MQEDARRALPAFRKMEVVEVEGPGGLRRERYVDAPGVGPGSFVNVMPFMVRELRLRGAELLSYACVYAFAREHANRVSRPFVAGMSGVGMRSARRCLSRLVRSGLLVQLDAERVEAVPLEELRRRAAAAVSAGEGCPVALVPLDPVNPHLYAGERVGPMHGFMVFGWMTQELGLSGCALLVYAYISSFSCDGAGGYRGDGFTDFSYSHIASTLGCGLRTVERAVSDLREAGYLEAQRLGTSAGGRRVRLRAVPLSELRAAAASEPSALAEEGADNLAVRGGQFGGSALPADNLAVRGGQFGGSGRTIWRFALLIRK